ncbi:MAG: hypothetical protein KDH88_00755 [Chromatiales bacterium]|nr:hypothetical protein [Chromatiales bacterium]
MSRDEKIARPLGGLLVVLAVLCLLTQLAHSQGINSFMERRVELGFRLFRTLLSADQDLDKRVDSGGYLPLYLLYRDESEDAQRFGEGLRRQSAVLRGIPVRVEVVSLDELLVGARPVPAGLYLGQPLFKRELRGLVEYGVANGVVVFSPFEGDVEKGALAGVAVESRVRPYINDTTLKRSGIRIKSFFLRVAKHYDETR